ncbi:hypothetical protein ABGN05_06530 [Aquibium sp. LZ166]|uniref:Cobalamin adenosyltransferase-like domain-containing protein n=1 Tax=Aquibium pacificus TaxID=3153579 RepID=A0ABV3SG67_9HYPH
MTGFGSFFSSSRSSTLKTKLRSGLVVDNDSPVMEVLGAIEELDRMIDVIKVFSRLPDVIFFMTTLQEGLSAITIEISQTGLLNISDHHLDSLAKNLELVGDGSPFTAMGREARAFSGLAAALCRRVERCMCTLIDLNCSATGLSDYPSGLQTPQSGLIYISGSTKLLDMLGKC